MTCVFMNTQGLFRRARESKGEGTRGLKNSGSRPPSALSQRVFVPQNARPSQASARAPSVNSY